MDGEAAPHGGSGSSGIAGQAADGSGTQSGSGFSHLVMIAAGVAVAAVVVAVVAAIIIKRRRAKASQRRSVPAGSSASKFDTIDAGVFYESQNKATTPHLAEHPVDSSVFEI